MEITFARYDLARIFNKSAKDIRCNYRNDYGKKLLTTTEQEAAVLLEKIAGALYEAPEEEV